MSLFASTLMVILASAEPVPPGSPVPPAVRERQTEYRAEYLARSPLKEIAAPEDSRVKGGGGSSGTDHDDWRIRVETERSETAVLDYYADELEKRGFALNSSIVEGSVALQTGTYVAPDGVRWHVLLLSSRGVAVADQIELLLRLTRLAE